MAKENEKKVSGEINEEELGNVAGGWCATGGMSMDEVPAEYIDSFTSESLEGGGKSVTTKFKDGKRFVSRFDKNGKYLGGNIFSN